MHFMGETGSQKEMFNLHFKCQQNNNLSVFNVQIIRLYSLGSWNFYVHVPVNFKIEASTEVSTTTLRSIQPVVVMCTLPIRYLFMYVLFVWVCGFNWLCLVAWTHYKHMPNILNALFVIYNFRRVAVHFALYCHICARWCKVICLERCLVFINQVPWVIMEDVQHECCGVVH